MQKKREIICKNGKKVVILRTFLSEMLISAAAHARGLPTDMKITLFIGGKSYRT